MTEAPALTELQKDKWRHKNAAKTLISQRLLTDLGRSVGMTTATQMVWLNRLTGSKPSHSPQQSCNRGHSRRLGKQTQKRRSLNCATLLLNYFPVKRDETYLKSRAMKYNTKYTSSNARASVWRITIFCNIRTSRLRFANLETRDGSRAEAVSAYNQRERQSTPKSFFRVFEEGPSDGPYHFQPDCTLVQKIFYYPGVGITNWNVKANVKVLEFQSFCFCLFVCFFFFFILTFLYHTNKAPFYNCLY